MINAILEENLAPHLIELQLSPSPNEMNESIKTIEVAEDIPKDISKKSRTKYYPNSKFNTLFFLRKKILD